MQGNAKLVNLYTVDVSVCFPIDHDYEIGRDKTSHEKKEEKIPHSMIG